MIPIRMAPLGEPKRRITDVPEPVEIPEEWPTTAPVEPERRREPVPV